MYLNSSFSLAEVECHLLLTILLKKLHIKKKQNLLLGHKPTLASFHFMFSTVYTPKTLLPKLIFQKEGER